MKFNEMLQKRYSAVFIAPDGIENVHEYASRRRQFLSRVKMPVVLSGVLREPGTEEEFYSTLDEVMKIQTEGRAKRQAAENELIRIETELKNKLLEVKG